MIKRFGVAAMAAVLLASGALLADDNAAEPGPPDSIAKQEAQLHAAAPAMVIVEYTLQYDKGDQPQGRYEYQDYVKDERPLEETGILVDAAHVVTADVQIHPRFIKSIAVRRYSDSGKDLHEVAAKVSAYPKSQNCQMLELAAPLDGAEPPAFDATRAGPYSVISMQHNDGRWSLRVQPMGNNLLLSQGRKLLLCDNRGLVVDAKGAAVAVLPPRGAIPADDSWKGSPMHWPMIQAADMDKMLHSLDDRASQSIVRVTLNFRSPKNISRDQTYHEPGNDPGATVQYVLGVLLDEKTLLVLSELKPTQTARLERIKIGGEPGEEAKFKASLTDYGAFVATLDKPAAAGGLTMSRADITALDDAELPSAEVFLQGDKRVSYVQPRRIAGFSIGWRRHLYPDIAGESHGLFLFDPDGAMLALPIARREKVSTEGRYSRDASWLITPLAQVEAALEDSKNGLDPGNVPLTEEQENRLAWVGIEMQPMNTELARANNVSDQTNDGDTGALVTFVYPDSPAGKAGVEPGWVLLRIDAAGQPKPIDVRVDPDPFSDQPFPWDRLDQAPEAVFDRIFQFTPWPRAGNNVVREITELGFGKKYTMEFFHDGRIDPKEFTVAEGPPHFDNAPKYKDDALGITVKNLTYEVRRYMQQKPDDPGVIISKIELGSLASKAGIKPYEVITHINDQPVMNVKDFARLMQGQTEVRLSVKRMTHGRIVRMKLGAGPEAATSKPATPAMAPATAPGGETPGESGK